MTDITALSPAAGEEFEEDAVELPPLQDIINYNLFHVTKHTISVSFLLCVL